MPGPDPTEPTWSVPELHDALEGLLLHAFGDQVWVEGELSDVSRSEAGHVYFSLVEPSGDGRGPAPSTPRLAVTLFATERQAVNRHLRANGGSVRMVDGVRVRIRGRLGTYAARSTLQLRMTWIDPAFTLGVMGLERDRLLAALSAEGLLGANASLPAPRLPLSVALVTSRTSAACADSLRQLEDSGLGFRVTVVDARTQGEGAAASLVAALSTAASLEVDVVLLVRGGGARTDLVAFDAEPVARAVAACPLPVVTGIGHQTDRTVADDVAHVAHPTPTAAAASLVAAVRTAQSELEAMSAVLATAAAGRAIRAAARVDRTAERAGRAARHHLDRDARRLARLGHRGALAAPRSLDEAERRLAERRRGLGGPARRLLSTRAERVGALGARARAHDPAALLARGWSITRDETGRPVRSPDDVAEGASLTTLLAGGTVESTVTRRTRTPPDEEPT